MVNKVSEEVRQEISDLLKDEDERSMWVSKAGTILRKGLGPLFHEAYIKAYSEHEHCGLCSLDREYVVKTRQLVWDCYTSAVGEQK